MLADLDFEDLGGVEDARPIEERPPRYYCAGYDRKDEDTGRRACNYKAYKKWYTACPECHYPYACKKIKRRDPEGNLRAAFDPDKIDDMEHIPSGIPELDKVLGGGLVYGNLVLMGGRKGGGKTRLLLKLCAGFAKAKRGAYFATGEDSRKKVEQFAKQMGIPRNDHFEIYGNPDGLDPVQVIEDISGRGFKLVVFDSLQVCSLSDKKVVGSLSQIEATVKYLSWFAKTRNVAFVLISQLVKEGDFHLSEGAQHDVDVLLRFDPCGPLANDEDELIPGTEEFRELWVPEKSRQGATGGRTYLEMTADGRLETPPWQVMRRLSKLKIV